MPIYEGTASLATTTQTPPYVLMALRGPSDGRAKLIELEVWTETAPTTSLILSLARSTALGTGSLTTVSVVNRDPSVTAARGQLITGWATARPTLSSSVYMKTIVMPATLGSGVMRSFDLTSPLQTELGGNAAGDLCLVLRSSTATGNLWVNFSYDA